MNKSLIKYYEIVDKMANLCENKRVMWNEKCDETTSKIHLTQAVPI